MPEIIGDGNVLIALDPQEATNLVLDKALHYDNILQAGPLKPYYIAPAVKRKLKMLHLSAPKNSLQPATDCDTWTPTVKFGKRTTEITVEDYELMGEMCHDEFMAGCVRNMQGSGRAKLSTSGSPEQEILENAMIALLRPGVSDDVYKTAYFGATDFNEVSYVHTLDLNAAGMPVDEQANLKAMLQVQDGWLELLRNDTTVKKLDTNGGTPGNNATLPANIEGFLQDLINNSSPVLRNWKRSMPRTEWAQIHLQTGLFRAYKEYLRSKGSDRGFDFILNGEFVPGVLTFDDYLVVEIPEWDMFDNEIGRISSTTGLSLSQRAMFVAPENLTIAHDMGTLDTVPGAAVAIQESPLLKDKRKKWMHGVYRFGFGYANSQLVTYAENSSDTYATS